ncbi:hypothetical protein RJ639_047614 [Escallonia herrerae]|uniref:Polygalacturonase n=1 Tax=Escallonia herrerae TaxID=1293975 RepID=A0AA88WA41_9ASTE|nr:hypothetical protein RJ639_047614 [Escallonia herrerae]
MHPDSSNDVCIEDCYISTGDDLIAIKSGWDEYGISFSHPSTNIMIHRIVGETSSSSGIAIGSEMSGGVSEVHAENLHFFNSNRAITIKTSPGRGGYVRNIYISGMTLANVNVAIKFIGRYGEHPDEFYDPNALPIIEMITIENVVGESIKFAGLLEGIEGDNFRNICLSNLSLSVTSDSPWNCSHVQGYSDSVSPEPCELLEDRIFPKHYSDCYHTSHLRNLYRRAWLLSRIVFVKDAHSQATNLSQRLRTPVINLDTYLGDASLSFFFKTEHSTCLEMQVSSSMENSVNFKSKLLLYLCLGDPAAPEVLDGEPENRLLGLENSPGDPGSHPWETRGVKPDP